MHVIRWNEKLRALVVEKKKKRVGAEMFNCSKNWRTFCVLN